MSRKRSRRQSLLALMLSALIAEFTGDNHALTWYELTRRVYNIPLALEPTEENHNEIHRLEDALIKYAMKRGVAVVPWWNSIMTGKLGLKAVYCEGLTPTETDWDPSDITLMYRLGRRKQIKVKQWDHSYNRLIAFLDGLGILPREEFDELNLTSDTNARAGIRERKILSNEKQEREMAEEKEEKKKA